MFEKEAAFEAWQKTYRQKLDQVLGKLLDDGVLDLPMRNYRLKNKSPNYFKVILFLLSGPAERSVSRLLSKQGVGWHGSALFQEWTLQSRIYFGLDDTTQMRRDRAWTRLFHA